MAQLDPRLLSVVPKSQAPERFKLRIHDIKPDDIEPNGDRYVVEAIDLDETILLGSLLVITQNAQQNPGDPQADPTVERRGVIAAVIVSAGNGHLLGLPDLAPVAKMTGFEEGDRPWPSVDMFYEPGDVVLVDHTAKGRALKILGREVRVVNQIDVLARINGIRLKRTGDTWVEEVADEADD